MCEKVIQELNIYFGKTYILGKFSREGVDVTVMMTRIALFRWYSRGPYLQWEVNFRLSLSHWNSWLAPLGNSLWHLDLLRFISPHPYRVQSHMDKGNVDS